MEVQPIESVDRRPAWRLQVLWAAVAVSFALLFIAGVRNAWTIAQGLQPDTLEMLAVRGIPGTAPATFLLVIDTLALLTFGTVGVLLLLRRPTERMAQIAGLMLLLSGLLYTAPAYESAAPLWLKSLIFAGAEVMQMTFIYAFPSGRFVPRWMPWALIPIAIWRFVIWHLYYLPNLFNLDRPGERYPFLPQDPRDIGLFMGLMVVGVVLQVYRYRMLSSSTERQQVKWLLSGFAAAVGIVGVYVLLLNLFGHLLPPQSGLIVRMGGRIVRHLALSLVPISLLYSILRYRLWEIDRLLSLTVAWSAGTGLLALLFGVLVVTLQVLFAPRTEAGATAIVAASTLATVTVAQPLYRRLQRGINRRFYRPGQSARLAVADLRARLREPVAMDQLAGHVLTVTQQAWQPQSATLWVPAQPAASTDAEEDAPKQRTFVRFRLEE